MTANQSESALQEAVQCPRCGYDQRGVIATWSDSCPLQGTCSECGLEFDWAPVMVPQKFEPKWCIEYAPRWRIFRSVGSTMLHSMLPWRFWSRLQMPHRVNPKRIVAYVSLFILPILLTYLAAQGGVGAYVRYQLQAAIDNAPQVHALHLRRLHADLQQMKLMEMQGHVNAAQEVARISQSIASYQQLQTAVFTIDHSYASAIIEAIIFPFAQTSSGRITHGANVSPYPAPGKLWIDAAGYSRIPLDGLQLLNTLIIWVASAFVMTLVLPISFALLPFTRVRFNVRWAHLGRIAAYSVVFPVALFVVVSAMTCYAAHIGDSSVLESGWLLKVCWFGPAICLFMWWAAATQCYLRMNHALIVPLMLNLLAYLFVLASMWLLLPETALPVVEFFYPLT